MGTHYVRVYRIFGLDLGQTGAYTRGLNFKASIRLLAAGSCGIRDGIDCEQHVAMAVLSSCLLGYRQAICFSKQTKKPSLSCQPWYSTSQLLLPISIRVLRGCRLRLLCNSLYFDESMPIVMVRQPIRTPVEWMMRRVLFL